MSTFTPFSALGCAAGGTARILRQGYRLLFFVLAGAGPLLAQAAPPAPAFQSRIEEATQTLANEPRLKRLSAQRRQALSEFVVGNMLFVMAHEIGHAVMGEMEIPVLGREEDAADAFAILNALKVGHDFSHGVLVEAAKGWFLSDRRDKKEANQLAYYDNHGLNLQRAYQIVCLMVGSDPKKFKDLADETKLPKERQQSCQDDYRVTSWSWETILKSHRRPADQPKQTIDVKYGDGKGTLAVYAAMFRAIQFLETIAAHASERFAWPRPFLLEMRSCGEADARWSGKARKLELCYELAQEFAELYRDYGQTSKTSKTKNKR